nr:hypothetical protein [Tanacetum cinerariifolium]
RNRINWHYVRDDALFSTIKVVSRHQTAQQYGAILPIELTTDEIRNNVGSHEEGKKSDEGDDDRDEGKLAKDDEEDKETGKGENEVRESEGESEEEEETREEEEGSF